MTAARRLVVSGSVALAMFISGCTVGPDYVTPEVTVGGSFKEANGWVQATPSSLDPVSPIFNIQADPWIKTMFAAKTKKGPKGTLDFKLNALLRRQRSTAV